MKKKTIKLKESDLYGIINRVLTENEDVGWGKNHGTLDSELLTKLDGIHDELWYTTSTNEYGSDTLSAQINVYGTLKNLLDEYPASKSLPKIKLLLNRIEFYLSGKGWSIERDSIGNELAELFYELTGRWEFSPESRM